MPRPMAVHVMRLLMVALTALCPVVLPGQAQVLRPLDSVRVRERDNVELGRPNAMAVTARGDAFVSDIADRKVVRISRAGDVTVVAARGAGPGEVISPTGLAMLGDSLLVVRNVGRRRLEYFEPRSGAYMGGRSYSGPSTGFSAWSGQVLMGSLRQGHGARPQGTAWAVYAGTNEPQLGGSLPGFYQELPAAASVFAHVEVGRDAAFVHGVFEVSNWLYRWTLGTGAVDSLLLATGARRGARPELIQELFKDQSKAARLAYQWSAPMLVAPVSRNRVAVLYSDPTPSASVYEGPSFLILADWKSRRSCREIRVPVPADVVPRFAVRGDTLWALVQRTTADLEPETWLVRWLLPAGDCR